MILPSGWVATALGECSDTIEYGLTARSTPMGKGYRYVRITDIQGDQIRWPSVPFAKADPIDFERSRILPGDILFARTGATVGKSHLVREVPELATFASYLIRVRCNRLIIEPEFARNFLQSPAYWLQIIEGAEGTGQPNFNGSKLANLRLPLPPLAEQRRIVAKLDALTARLARARAELERISVLARQLRNASLSAARKSTVNYPTQTVSQLVLVSFDGPFGSNLKSADYEQEGAQVIRIENIGHLSFRGDKKIFIHLDKYSSLTRHTLAPGDILFASFVDQEVRICRFPRGLKGPSINKADCFVLRIDESKCNPDFLVYFLAAPETYRDMREAVHGATRPRIGLSQLRNYPVHIPSLQQQCSIVEQIRSRVTHADRLEAEAARAKELLDRLEGAILAKALRGELVPQDPADEPASVLLDRIRAERAATPKTKRGRRTAAQVER